MMIHFINLVRQPHKKRDSTSSIFKYLLMCQSLFMFKSICQEKLPRQIILPNIRRLQE